MVDQLLQKAEKSGYKMDTKLCMNFEVPG